MAKDTNPSLQNAIIYSVFVRNHTPEGTFAALERDLIRIKDLGVDIIWLMPIHPIGKKGRKGTLGSPYANQDYRSVNPELGTLEEFQHLVDAIHSLGMRVIIDVVYNHTSLDSVLWNEHPEYFYRTKTGQPANRLGDWSDVIDLNYEVPELWDYQIETLCQWAAIVDGFRCDVASFVPLEFWKRARAAVAKVRPDAIWLAETVHRNFGETARRLGFYSFRDSEGFEAFDIEYPYDVEDSFENFLTAKTGICSYLDVVDFQEAMYVENYNKLRFLENHDMPRIASKIDGRRWAGYPDFDMNSLLAFTFMLKGTTLLYGGQEVMAAHRPSLFEKDPVDWSALGSDRDLSGIIRRLCAIKHETFGATDVIRLWGSDQQDAAILVRDGERGRTVGVFSLTGQPASLTLLQPGFQGQATRGRCLPDGTYMNLIDGSSISVTDGVISTPGQPAIVKMNAPLPSTPQ